MKKKRKLSDVCWDGYEAYGHKMKNGKKVPNCVPIKKEELELEKELRLDEAYWRHFIEEAKYQGREVELNKKMPGDVAKSKVYVRDPKTGNVKKINFGEKGARIKKDNPARRKSFRARHNCKDAKDKTTARYWSCKSW